MIKKGRAYEEARIRRIRNKYGADAFRRWGEEGGNKYLLALRRGDTLVIRKRTARHR